MMTDFEGLDELLTKDMYKFLDDLKDTLIPMLDDGLETKLKADLIRALHGLKSLSGMYELHHLTEFISQAEDVTHKIYKLDKKTIANDLLNDLFVIKDQIELQIKEYLKTHNKTISQNILDYNEECIEEYTRHYVEYKLNNKKVSDTPPSAKAKPTNIATPANDTTSSKKDFFIEDNVMNFAPLSLHKDDASDYQQLFVSNLDNVKEIRVDLRQTNKLDIAGVQFIQAIKKHCKVSGIKFVLIGVSALVELEAGMLGVEL